MISPVFTFHANCIDTENEEKIEEFD